MMNTQRKIKLQKKEIVNETAQNVGFWEEVINEIPVYALIDAVKNSANMITEMTPDADIKNMIVTEAVKVMNYQDFKEINRFFFNLK